MKKEPLTKDKMYAVNGYKNLIVEIDDVESAVDWLIQKIDDYCIGRPPIAVKNDNTIYTVVDLIKEAFPDLKPNSKESSKSNKCFTATPKASPKSCPEFEPVCPKCWSGGQIKKDCPICHGTGKTP